MLLLFIIFLICLPACLSVCCLLCVCVCLFVCLCVSFLGPTIPRWFAWHGIVKAALKSKRWVIASVKNCIVQGVVWARRVAPAGLDTPPCSHRQCHPGCVRRITSNLRQMRTLVLQTDLYCIFYEAVLDERCPSGGLDQEVTKPLCVCR